MIKVFHPGVSHQRSKWKHTAVEKLGNCSFKDYNCWI